MARQKLLLQITIWIEFLCQPLSSMRHELNLIIEGIKKYITKESDLKNNPHCEIY